MTIDIMYWNGRISRRMYTKLWAVVVSWGWDLLPSTFYSSVLSEFLQWACIAFIIKKHEIFLLWTKINKRNSYEWLSQAMIRRWFLTKIIYVQANRNHCPAFSTEETQDSERNCTLWPSPKWPVVFGWETSVTKGLIKCHWHSHLEATCVSAGGHHVDTTQGLQL